MARHPLSNAAWGFDSNCFVCDPGNARGLRIPFFHDDEAGLVTAEFVLGAEHSGAPHYAHGGVLLAILDEAMAWASIALAERFAVVQSTATTFDRPVRIDEPHRVEASVSERTDTAVTARASVVDAGDRVCAEARARLVVMSSAVAGAAVGPVGGADIRYLRPLPDQETQP
ncbi:MAG TPA: PaaI family thioesterase [Acidimicrobiales bacterium]|nr:PaaI family thioesterase [Acidimicrobiales bacterium]